MKRLCPINCRRPIADRQIMCPDHYSDLPEEHKRAIKASKRSTDSKEYVAAVTSALQHLLDEDRSIQELEDYINWYRS